MYLLGIFLKVGSLDKIIINGSEHKYNLGFSEVLMLRNYARVNSFDFNSQIGGCESVRDIQMTRFMGAEFIEISYIESIFAFDKLVDAFTKIYSSSSYEPMHIPKILLMVESLLSLNVLSEVIAKAITLKDSISVIPIYNRRSLISELFENGSQDFEVEDYRNQINPLIQESVNTISQITSDYEYGLAGGLNFKSVISLQNGGLLPNLLYLGLFSIFNQHTFVHDLSLDHKLKRLHNSESLLLGSMSKVMNSRQDKMMSRQHHLMDYLLEHIS